MKKILAIIFLAAVVSGGLYFFKNKNKKVPELIPAETEKAEETIEKSDDKEAEKNQKEEIKISFVGPRENLPENAPSEYGLWSFAYPVPGKLSRSGQPLIGGFQWLKDNGWKSIVNFRIEGDHAPEISDDEKIPGFKELGFNYLRVEMLDGAAPTDEQAEKFLEFVTREENLPAHIHCRGGYGRAGVMTALYRYAVQGWPVEEAIEESILFRGGISEGQKKWIRQWSETHAPGSYAGE